MFGFVLDFPQNPLLKTARRNLEFGIKIEVTFELNNSLHVQTLNTGIKPRNSMNFSKQLLEVTPNIS